MFRYTNELQRLSVARTSADPKFVRHLENVKGMKDISERQVVSLEYAARLAQMKSDRELRELDDEEDDDDDEETAKKKRRRRNERKKDDVVLDEAKFILMDLIRLTEGGEIPQPRAWWL